jgi:hypothetical protein
MRFHIVILSHLMDFVGNLEILMDLGIYTFMQSLFFLAFDHLMGYLGRGIILVW